MDSESLNEQEIVDTEVEAAMREMVASNEDDAEAERHSESSDEEETHERTNVTPESSDTEDEVAEAVVVEEDDAPMSSSSVAPKSKKKKQIEGADSDSESDYNDSSSSDDDSDIDVDIDIAHEASHAGYNSPEEEIEPRYPRQAGIASIDTRGTRRKCYSRKFHCAPLGYTNKNFPRHYDKLSIVGRLRIDIRDNEIDQLKKRHCQCEPRCDQRVCKDATIKLISAKARDEYRLQFMAMYRCIIRTAFDIERGRTDKNPTTIPDEAVNEALHIYFRCPMGRA